MTAPLPLLVGAGLYLLAASATLWRTLHAGRIVPLIGLPPLPISRDGEPWLYWAAVVVLLALWIKIAWALADTLGLI